jgi:3-oxoacyl-[acyl-carrier protein] reductase
MDTNLNGKHAIVCGASKGIGRATALELASLGAAVTLIARNHDALEAVRALMAHAERHHVVVADFSAPQALAKSIGDHLARHGAAHILVNNTGGPAAGPASDATLDQFERAFAQHLLCNHVMAQACLPGMKAAGYGRIINVISTSVKQPIPGIGVSNTIRAAVANWAKTLSAEVARFGITVNNVLPGSTDTGRLAEIFNARAARQNKTVEEIVAHERANVPAGRFARPEEIAYAIAFLAGPAAAYINGINLPVDGGRTGCL